MAFLRFVRACSKYNFVFYMHSYPNLSLTLRSRDTSQNIYIEYEYSDFSKIFKEAVRKMKEYRNNTR